MAPGNETRGVRSLGLSVMHTSQHNGVTEKGCPSRGDSAALFEFAPVRAHSEGFGDNLRILLGTRFGAELGVASVADESVRAKFNVPGGKSTFPWWEAAWHIGVIHAARKRNGTG